MSKSPSRSSYAGVDHPAPLPELQKKRERAVAASEKSITSKAKASKKVVAPKKPTASRKRKTSEPETESSGGVITNVSNTVETLTTITEPLELNLQVQPEIMPVSNDGNSLPSMSEAQPSVAVTNGPPFEPETGGHSTHKKTETSVERIPKTPVSKKYQRRKKADTVSPTKPVPFTPTPSGVGLIAGPENARRTIDTDHMLDDLASLNRKRPAATDVTNAPVLTPNGSQVVINDSPSKKRKANDLPPDVGSPMKSTSTIDTLLKDAEAHLVKVDRKVAGNGRLEKLIAGRQCKMFNPEGLREVVDPFTALASGIIGQQVRWQFWRRVEHQGVSNIHTRRVRKEALFALTLTA